jgi:hypothetical protein
MRISSSGNVTLLEADAQERHEPCSPRARGAGPTLSRHSDSDMDRFEQQSHLGPIEWFPNSSWSTGIINPFHHEPLKTHAREL